MLRVNNLIGFGKKSSVVSQPVTVTNTDERTASASDPTFSDVLFGDDVPERTVVISLGMNRASSTDDVTKPSSVTIGGVSATIVAEGGTEHLSVTNWTQIWAASVSGVSGSVVLAGSVATRVTMAVYDVRNLQSLVPVEVNSDSLIGGSGTISAPVGSVAGGVVFAVYALRATNTETIDGGLTEDYNASPGTLSRGIHSHLTTSAATTVTPTNSITQTAVRILMAAAMR